MNNIRQTCFFNENFNVAQVVIIERKMKRKMAIIPRKI
jgi:hypothetical protein